MCLNTREDTIYAASGEGYINILDIKNKTITRTIEVVTERITSMSLYHDDFNLLITDSIGRILI